MIEKRKYKKVSKGGAYDKYGNYILNSSEYQRRQQQYQHPQTTSSSSSSSESDRCTTKYFNSSSSDPDKFDDKYTELLSQFKWNRNTKTAISKYNELLTQYNHGKKTGIFSSKIVCGNMSKNNKSGTCGTLKSTLKTARNTVLNAISQNIKSKLETRLNKIKINPKTKRLDRFACHIKLYTDLLNNSYCKLGQNERKIYNISKIITDLKAKFPKDPEFAEAYINYMMKKRETAREKLKLIQTDEKFSEELKKLITSYPNCSA